MSAEPVSGSFWFLFAYDVCEEIDLERLRGLISADPPSLPPDSAPFERPPVVETLPPQPDSPLRGAINYYDYGVLSIRLELPFSLTWPGLVDAASSLADLPEPHALAAATVRARIAAIGGAMVHPRDPWLEEEYHVIHVHSPATALLASNAAEIAQIVRAEQTALAPAEQEEILRHRLSYYPNDLIVIGWTAAFLHDTPDGAAAAVRLLEYANTQLLEFRYYDHVLTGVLAGVYQSLGKQSGLLSRWRMAREARQLNTLLLEVRELTERADTAIKFLSDMYAARVYRLAAEKLGVGDFRRLVDTKLHTASELYRFMMDQFHASRAFVLELMVVIILIIDLIYLFRGKS
jgi:hypothetical protein